MLEITAHAPFPIIPEVAGDIEAEQVTETPKLASPSKGAHAANAAVGQGNHDQRQMD